MSNTSASLKIAGPYARALFEHAFETNILHAITADFYNLSSLFKKTPELLECLKNPVINSIAKKEIVFRLFDGKVNSDTIQFFNILIDRNRISLIIPIITRYLELVYETANVKYYEIKTAFALTKFQKINFIRKLKTLSNAREIRLKITVDKSLIGGILIKTSSNVLDYSVKNQLTRIAKYFDTILEI